MRQFSLIAMILIAAFAIYQSLNLRSAAPTESSKKESRDLKGVKEKVPNQSLKALSLDEKNSKSQEAQTQNTGDQSSLPAYSTLSQSKVSNFAFRQVNHFERDTTAIDYKFIEGGTPFDVPLQALKNLQKDDQVTLDLGPIHFVLNGEVVEAFTTENQQIAVHISFPEDGPESAIFLHFDAQGHMEAKLYTSAGSFELIHNGHVGFIISFEEMETLERLEAEP